MSYINRQKPSGKRVTDNRHRMRRPPIERRQAPFISPDKRESNIHELTNNQRYRIKEAVKPVFRAGSRTTPTLEVILTSLQQLVGHVLHQVGQLADAIRLHVRHGEETKQVDLTYDDFRALATT